MVAGAALSMKRKTTQKKCQYINCKRGGKPYPGLAVSKYCTDTCRYAAAYERRKAAVSKPKKRIKRKK